MLRFRNWYMFTLVNFSQVKGTIKRIRLGRTGTSLKVGFLGMANIGKSSTFNLLSNLNVPAQNIPFCTVDPNLGMVSVHDARFDRLVELYKPQKSMGPRLKIVDIAGLVRGASEGYGLGNQFLSHISQVDALFHVVRAFANQQIVHTEGQADAIRDIKIIKHELIQKDLSLINKKVQENARKAKNSQDKQFKLKYDFMIKVQKYLKNQVQIRNVQWKNQEIQELNKFLFLTSKPIIFLINLSKQDYLQKKIPNLAEMQAVMTQNGKYSAKFIAYSVQHEKNRSEEQPSQIEGIIKASYEQLQLIHFYTVGKDEVRAWPIRKGETALQAGNKIHSDFGKAFANAEVIHADNLLSHPEYKDKLAKFSKKQGKTYIVKDGDIVHFNCKIK